MVRIPHSRRHGDLTLVTLISFLSFHYFLQHPSPSSCLKTPRGLGKRLQRGQDKPSGSVSHWKWYHSIPKRAELRVFNILQLLWIKTLFYKLKSSLPNSQGGLEAEERGKTFALRSKEQLPVQSNMAAISRMWKCCQHG